MAAPRLKCQDKTMTKQDKAQRLAAALRDNLRRRKAQARGLSEQPDGDRNRNGNGDRDTD